MKIKINTDDAVVVVESENVKKNGPEIVILPGSDLKIVSVEKNDKK